MKTKLLKKIRKRFSYYTKNKNDFVLVDHHKKKVKFIDKKYARSLFTGDGKPDCGWSEVKLRILKDHILNPFITDPLGQLMYRSCSIKSGVRPNKH